MANTNLSNMFKLFSVAFTPPTAAWAETLASGMLAQDMATVWRALELPEEDISAFCEALSVYRGGNAEDVLHAVRQDWSHLYLGDPPLVNGSEGVWRKRAEGRRGVVRMINSYSVEVADFMRECGVRRKEGFNDCIDHIEEELDFCAFLASQPEYLVELGKDPLDLLEAFVQEHLEKWVPGLCADVRAHARSTYYRALSDLMAAFMRAF